MASESGGPLGKDSRGAASSADLPTLADLFAASALAAGLAARVSARIELPAVLRPGSPASAPAGGLRPRTPFQAAWLLLQKQWRDAEDGRCRPSLDATAESWLLQIDGASALAPAAKPLGDIRWLAASDAGAVAPVADDAGPRILLSAGTSPGLTLDAPAALMDAAQARSVLQSIVQTASELLSRPQACLRDIDTLGAAERHRLFEEWNPATPLASRMRYAVHSASSVCHAPAGVFA